ncbi:MAG TPA: NCS1 family nucleobase:cation symporter-1 [Pirellulales bacterium]|jgi:NCS1 family nucleobase:cation symporter-1|nr:NCS1 family nucleobase:cation symporter-1 [Pirellulales bacterium]
MTGETVSSPPRLSPAPGEICQLTEDVSGSKYFSRDLAPISAAGRKWGTRDLAMLWISMAACIPTYMLASSLIEMGMDWRQAVTTIFLGNCIVLVPMIMNAHAGTRYGIPFPVYCRAAFGVRGANVPALMRALVACGWFGIQTWIGGMALHTLLAVELPAWTTTRELPGLEISASQLACFLAFWLVNVLVVWRGMESIRLLLNIKAPLLIVLGLMLLAWAYHQAGGFGPILSQPSQFAAGQPKEGQFWKFFFPALTANVSFWATLSLNIPDFSRFAYSQRDQVLGQVLGLPGTMGLYSFIGVAVTSATTVIYGAPIWDPVKLLTKFSSPLTLVFAMFALCLATLATNIAANVVGPANDFAHLWPKRISFRAGGLITGLLGILIQPWRLLANAEVYIDKWLIGYSLLLGACGGVLIADYFFIRRTRLDLAGLYRAHGPYWYRGGWNPWALVALAAGIAPCLPGFAVAAGLVDAAEAGVADLWIQLYSYAWFVSFAISLVSYVVLMKIFERPGGVIRP